MWIWYLAIKMAHFYDFADGWEEKPALLLIDEIENQLHPTWQRRVIRALSQRFKGLQIFATTHSPFVVAGLEAGQVHKLYKNKEGAIQTERNRQNIAGWTVEEILREFMEVHDPTDFATAEDAATLRWLRYQQPQDGTVEEWRKETISKLESNAEATTDEASALRWLRNQNDASGGAIEWWQLQVDKLRSTVSRDLEASSAVMAQRELLFERLSELLETDDETEAED